MIWCSNCICFGIITVNFIYLKKKNNSQIFFKQNYFAIFLYSNNVIDWLLANNFLGKLRCSCTVAVVLGRNHFIKNHICICHRNLIQNLFLECQPNQMGSFHCGIWIRCGSVSVWIVDKIALQEFIVVSHSMSKPFAVSRECHTRQQYQIESACLAIASKIMEFWRSHQYDRYQQQNAINGLINPMEPVKVRLVTDHFQKHFFESHRLSAEEYSIS